MTKQKPQKQKQHQTKTKSPERLIVIGLGNPGENYRGTRHNAGFAVVEKIADKNNIILKKPFFKPMLAGEGLINGCKIYLVKPLTFMNLSGRILKYLPFKKDQEGTVLLIICDNMDLQPGVIRLKTGGSSAGHNGIKSIIEYADTADFSRLYIGVGRARKEESVIDHVLGTMEKDDKIKYEAALEAAADAVAAICEKPINQVMNGINRKNI